MRFFCFFLQFNSKMCLNKTFIPEIYVMRKHIIVSLIQKPGLSLFLESSEHILRIGISFKMLNYGFPGHWFEESRRYQLEGTSQSAR